ncbi:chaperone protein ClpB [Tanacetum coccineum]
MSPVSCYLHLVLLTVGEEQVARALSELTGIPSSTFGKNAMEKVKSLKDWLNSQVIGQKEVVTTVCEIVKRTLDEDNMKPGSLLFTGTTRAGKTEMAKALTEHLFGDCMIRFDMNEFSQSNTVTRFFGPPPGYKGHKDGGQLLQAVRKKPFCVILLDEFDKACTKSCCVS